MCKCLNNTPIYKLIIFISLNRVQSFGEKKKLQSFFVLEKKDYIR